MRRGRVSSDKWIEIKHRVPSMYERSKNVDAGGLIGAVNSIGIPIRTGILPTASEPQNLSSFHLPLSPSSSRTLKRSDFRASMGGVDSTDLTSQLPAHHEPPKSKNVKTKAMARSWKNNFILGPYSFTDKADLNMYSRSVSFRVGL